MLKDGSPSFSLAANEIGAMELACVSHMGRVGKGVGTKGNIIVVHFGGSATKRRYPQETRIK